MKEITHFIMNKLLLCKLDIYALNFLVVGCFGLITYGVFFQSRSESNRNIAASIINQDTKIQDEIELDDTDLNIAPKSHELDEKEAKEFMVTKDNSGENFERYTDNTLSTNDNKDDQVINRSFVRELLQESITLELNGNIRLSLSEARPANVLKVNITDDGDWSAFQAVLIDQEEIRLLGYFSNSQRDNQTDFAPNGELDKDADFEWVDIPLPLERSESSEILIMPVSIEQGMAQDVVKRPINVQSIVAVYTDEYKLNVYPMHLGLNLSGIPNGDNIFWQSNDWEGHNLAYVSYEEATNRGLIKIPIYNGTNQTHIGMHVYGERKGHIEILDQAGVTIWHSRVKTSTVIDRDRPVLHRIKWQVPVEIIKQAQDSDGHVLVKIVNSDQYEDRLYIQDIFVRTQ